MFKFDNYREIRSIFTYSKKIKIIAFFHIPSEKNNMSLTLVFLYISNVNIFLSRNNTPIFK